jgi:hypothetical protein
MRSAHRAFTMVEAVLCVAAAGAITSLGAVGLGSQPGGTKADNQQLKDATQVRGIHQAFVVFAQNHGDQYPLPSKVDAKDLTINGGGRAKDTTANIYSMLVFNGSISTEMLVSPLEKNPAVSVASGYEFNAPKAAAVPAKALWDPAGIKTGLDDKDRGNASYAHLQPAGRRLLQWSNTFSANQALIGTRGPQITGAASVKDDPQAPPVVTLPNPQSIALGLLGDGTWWSGNIAFNDNHVEFLEKGFAHGKPAKAAKTYWGADGKERPDLLFFDEPEDKEARNSFLGLWRTAGQDRLQYRGNWD